MANERAAITEINGQMPATLAKEFDLNDLEFDKFRRVIHEMTGINMAETKRELVYRRVSARLKATGISTFPEYLKFLKQGDPNEVELFTNSVTTNLTSFFRENHHFEFLADTIFPEVVQKKHDSDRRLRIWSAGCSTGEEPYSIAMTIREKFKMLSNWDVKVLCTDLDTEVLARGSDGIYPKKRVETIPDGRLRKWFAKSSGDGPERYKVSSKLRELVTFKPLNLMHDWPLKGPFEVIFCRNVLIYFDKPTQTALAERYADLLADGGYLMLGHSESLFNVSDRFALVGKTIYRKIA